MDSLYFHRHMTKIKTTGFEWLIFNKIYDKQVHLFVPVKACIWVNNWQMKLVKCEWGSMCLTNTRLNIIYLLIILSYLRRCEYQIFWNKKTPFPKHFCLTFHVFLACFCYKIHLHYINKTTWRDKPVSRNITTLMMMTCRKHI